jgi:serine phosphatase RsbU (regulator of sigma subunit)
MRSPRPAPSAGVAAPVAKLRPLHRVERALAEATLPVGTAGGGPASLVSRPLLEETEGIEVVATYIPAGGDRPVGGDWYDAFVVGDRVSLSVGDACGHGIEAAGLSARARNAIRALTFHGIEPAGVLETTSKMVTTPEQDFATCVLLSYDLGTRRISWVRAGHVPVLLQRGQQARFLTASCGVPLGIFPDSGYRQAALTTEPGDVLVLYTDGLVETPGTPLDAGLDELRTLTVSCPTDSAAELNDRLRRRLAPVCPRDDICLITVRLG